jgi:predicted nuclease of predicted toxin-antitoxin system
MPSVIDTDEQPSRRLLSEYPFLTDENIHPHVVAMLRSRGIDVWDVKEQNKQGTSDTELLRLAHGEGRIVLTHDSDFGALATAFALEWVGIIYLRPGLQRIGIVLENLAALFEQEIRPHVPFIVVVERKSDHVKIRVR